MNKTVKKYAMFLLCLMLVLLLTACQPQKIEHLPSDVQAPEAGVATPEFVVNAPEATPETPAESEGTAAGFNG